MKATEIDQVGEPSFNTDPEVAAAIADVLAGNGTHIADAAICHNCRFHYGSECRRHAPPWPTTADTDYCGDWTARQ